MTCLFSLANIPNEPRCSSQRAILIAFCSSRNRRPVSQSTAPLQLPRVFVSRRGDGLINSGVQSNAIGNPGKYLSSTIEGHDWVDVLDLCCQLNCEIAGRACREETNATATASALQLRAAFLFLLKLPSTAAIYFD